MSDKTKGAAAGSTSAAADDTSPRRRALGEGKGGQYAVKQMFGHKGTLYTRGNQDELSQLPEADLQELLDAGLIEYVGAERDADSSGSIAHDATSRAIADAEAQKGAARGKRSASPRTEA